jgi:DNA-binding CsgD family transcriptional regulator
MTSALERLTEAVAVLADEATVLELAVRALHETCPRGAAFGITAHGPRSDRVGTFRIMHGGAWLDLALSHLAYVRTPAIDVSNVPLPQRNRWVEPFVEGIATPEGFKKSTLYPLVAHLGMLDQGRIFVCAGPRLVAFAGASIPEGTHFSDGERSRLSATSVALVVPLRVASLLADVHRRRSPLDELLEGTTDTIFATDRRGVILGSSKPGSDRLRRDRDLPARVAVAVRASRRCASVVRDGDRAMYLSPCSERGVAWLVAVDGDAWTEPPVELTPRQRELLALLDKGLTNAEIAMGLKIAAPTVKTMLERLYRRAGVSNRVELLAWSRTEGVAMPSMAPPDRPRRRIGFRS